MVIILFIWFFVISLILLLLSKIQFSVLNKENTNYVKLKFPFFTLYLDYERFMKSLKRISIKKDIGIKQQFNLYKSYNPLIKDILKHVVIDKANFYKFFNEYSQTYEIITYYLFSSYFNSFCNFNFKKIKDYSYDVIYSKERKDLDFVFKCKVRIYYLVFSFIKNIKVLFQKKKRRSFYGS